MKYFSVDRRNMCFVGKQFNLIPSPASNDNEIVSHIKHKFPDGFSRHGAQYFSEPWENPPPAAFNAGLIELLLESTRKAYYPDKPSRYQSMFAWGSLDSALIFRESYGELSNSIYEFQPTAKIHKGDMNIYRLADTFAAIDHRLHLYWQGKSLETPGYSPNWEYILELPVLVTEKVM